MSAIKDTIANRVLGNPLIKGTFIIGSGAAIAQIISIVSSPIITRIYSPVDYGTLSVFISLISILTVVASFKYDNAIPVPENDEDAELLLILSLLICALMAILIFIILIFTGNYLATLLHFESIMPYYWLLCIGFIGIAIYQILTYWVIRKKEYTTITQTKISQSIAGLVTKIILGLLSFGSLGLICGEIIGRIMGIGTLGRTILPRMWKSRNKIDLKKIRAVGIHYKKFPVFSMPAALISVVSTQAPVLFISMIFGLQTVGLFSLSYSMLLLPVSLISSSITQVFFGEMSDLYRKKSDRMLSFYRYTTKNLFIFGAPIILIGSIFSPLLFPIIFGEAWKESGIFALPLCPCIIALFVVSSTSDVMVLTGYNDWWLAWNIGRTLMIVFGFYLAIYYEFSPLITVLLYSLIMTLTYIILYFLSIKVIKKVTVSNRDTHGDIH